MSEAKYTILESWPMLKDDLREFLLDTDGWIMSKLKEAHHKKDWAIVLNLLDIMQLVKDISSHRHE